MNNLGVIVCGIGLQDSLNPTIFMTSAIFIAGGFWLASSPLRIFWLRVIFVLAYVLSFLGFVFGPAQIFILRKEFFFAAKIIYFILSIGAFSLGAVFLKDWFLLNRGPMPKDQELKKAKPFSPNGLVVLLVTVVLAVILSALAAIGPMNNYIVLLGNLSLLRGQWLMVMPLLGGYLVFNMWPVWFVWALLSIKDLRPSFLKIICASIFFTASSCIILTFR